MKKLIAIALIAIMVMSLAACGTINKTEVSILWSSEGVATVPNSLINAVERAMYIENVSYKHYGAKGDQATQTQQATDALNAGCSALVVELVEGGAAQAIVDAAKAKNVPIIFFNCDASQSAVSSYDKCALVNTNTNTLAKVQGEQIAAALIKAGKDGAELVGDRNKDGKISYIGSGYITPTVNAINTVLAANKQPALVAVEGEVADVIGSFTDEAAAAELIITDDDTAAQEILLALQAKGYNKDRLTTHNIPVFTVGDEADYKELVLAGRPEGKREDAAVQEYFKSMQYIVDLRNVEEDSLASMIYTTSSIIEDGRLSGTVIEDYDSIAVALGAVLRNLLKGESAFKGISADLIFNSCAVRIPYTTVG